MQEDNKKTEFQKVTKYYFFLSTSGYPSLIFGTRQYTEPMLYQSRGPIIARASFCNCLISDSYRKGCWIFHRFVRCEILTELQYCDWGHTGREAMKFDRCYYTNVSK